MTASDRRTPRPGPNGRPVRPFVMPDSARGKLRVWRFILWRRAVQFGVLLLFLGTVRWGWSLAGEPILAGNLSASTVLGIIPLSDPFAVLQILLTGNAVSNSVLIGAGLVLALYGLVGGRSWCAWVCPVNMVTDLAGWLRNRLGPRDSLRLPRDTRYLVLGLTLLLSSLTGVAAFEWVSPIGMLHRELIFGLGLGWAALLGVFLLDLLIMRHGWCGHLCPLGAFYSLYGRYTAQLRVRFDGWTCTHCGECAKVCPEPQVLNLKQATEAGMIRSGECTNCGRCIPVCPENTLHFDLRPRLVKHEQPATTDPRQRRVT